MIILCPGSYRHPSLRHNYVASASERKPATFHGISIGKLCHTLEHCTRTHTNAVATNKLYNGRSSTGLLGDLCHFYNRHTEFLCSALLVCLLSLSARASLSTIGRSPSLWLLLWKLERHSTKNATRGSLYAKWVKKGHDNGNQQP